jgi:hypothetical protein
MVDMSEHRVKCPPWAVPAAFAIHTASAKPRWRLSNVKRLYQETRFVTIMLIRSACVQRGTKVISGSGNGRRGNRPSRKPRFAMALKVHARRSASARRVGCTNPIGTSHSDAGKYLRHS